MKIFRNFSFSKKSYVVLVGVVAIIIGGSTSALFINAKKFNDQSIKQTEVSTVTPKPGTNQPEQELVSTQDTQSPQDEPPKPTPKKPTETTPELIEPPQPEVVFSVDDIPKEIYGRSEYHAIKRRIEVDKPDTSIKDKPTGLLLTNYYCGQNVLVNTPSQYAIVCMTSMGQTGHMAFIEEIFEDGSMRISEMNSVGFNIVNERVLSKGQAAAYRYIP